MIRPIALRAYIFAVPDGKQMTHTNEHVDTKLDIEPDLVGTQGGSQSPERRQRHHRHAKISLWQRLSSFLINSGVSDVLSAHDHSEDFRETRAAYIAIRLRLMAYVFAIVVPLMSVFDYLTLQLDHFFPLLVLRLTLSFLLLVLASFSSKRRPLLVMRVILPLAFVLPTLFYVGCIAVFSQQSVSDALVGFTILPMLIVAMMGLFPLTLLSGCTIISLILLPSVALEYYLGSLFTLESLNKLWLFGMFAGISLWLQLGQLLMLLKLYRESTLDPLTGLINRRVLIRRLEHEQLHVKRNSHTFSILMFDLDRFKRINDTHGHQAGDQVLKVVANLLKKQVRKTDIIARFGGEEFIAVLPGYTSVEATIVAERIRKAINKVIIRLNSGVELQVSTSIGVSEYEPWEDIEQTLRRVDDALYNAKSAGRDQVTTMTAAEHAGSAVASSSTDDANSAPAAQQTFN